MSAEARPGSRRRAFVCVLDMADGEGAGSAALALSGGRLWFSVELKEPQVLRRAAIVAQNSRAPLKVELFTRSEPVPRSSLVGWIAVPELGELGDGLLRGHPFRLEVVSEALLMEGPLLEVSVERPSSDAPEETPEA